MEESSFIIFEAPPLEVPGFSVEALTFFRLFEASSAASAASLVLTAFSGWPSNLIVPHSFVPQ